MIIIITIIDDYRAYYESSADTVLYHDQNEDDHDDYNPDYQALIIVVIMITVITMIFIIYHDQNDYPTPFRSIVEGGARSTEVGVEV